MVKVTITFDKSAVEDIPEKTEAIVKKGKNLVAQNMIRNLTQNSPVEYVCFKKMQLKFDPALYSNLKKPL